MISWRTIAEFFGITEPTSAITGATATKLFHGDGSWSTVATADIADSAVTTAKIADSHVTTAKIADSNVTTAKIADANVTLTKMANLAQDAFIIRTTGSTGVPETATCTAAARTVLDDTTVAAMVNTLGGANSVGSGGLSRITTSSFTASLTGCTTVPTGTAYYSVNGNAVTLDVPGLFATSNATSKTITGAPDAIKPATAKRGVYIASDNGGAMAIAAFSIGTNGVITLYPNTVDGNWTASGVADFRAFSAAYTLN